MTVKSNEEIFDVVLKHITEICEDIEPDSVTSDASMKDLGASSLDIVEVVSCSMRELRVRVPRSELSKLSSIGGLVDLLQESVEAKAAG